jgi:hypothetical protein
MGIADFRHWHQRFIQRSTETGMERIRAWRKQQEGKLGYIILWALGVPIPLLFVIFLLRGCN